LLRAGLHVLRGRLELRRGLLGLLLLLRLAAARRDHHQRHGQRRRHPSRSHPNLLSRPRHRTRPRPCYRLPARTALSASRYWRAAAVIRPYSPAAIALFDTSSPPTPTATAPASKKAPIVSRFTPPVGHSGICGNGARSARM